MNRRDMSMSIAGVAAGVAVTVGAQQAVTAAPLGSAVYPSNDLHGMRNAGDGPASYFVLRWTSPGKEGPRPGDSR